MDRGAVLVTYLTPEIGEIYRYENVVQIRRLAYPACTMCSILVEFYLFLGVFFFRRAFAERRNQY